MICDIRIRIVRIEVANIIKCLVVVKVCHCAPILVKSRVVVTAKIHQRLNGTEICYQRCFTSLMILQMVYLPGKAADEMVNEEVEGVLLEFGHHRLET